MTTVEDAVSPAQTRPNVFVRLYRGETSFDFVGRRRLWYLISAIIIVAGIGSMATRGFNWGIDFKGGSSWEVTAPGVTTATVQNAITKTGVTGATIEILGGRTVQVEADLNNLSPAQQQVKEAAVSAAMAQIGNVPAAGVTYSNVGPTWGSQITNKAILAVAVFFVLVVLYITFRFEWKMAIAALVAVIHDLLVTAGIYSLTGFQVTPDTVVAVLTILGYSLYDTVVVFDRVMENTKGFGASGRMTYEDVVNLSMNQTLARSMNTSLVAILPVLSVLVIGAQVLGATTLQYFGLALVIGLTSGAYSSIFIASPLLAGMKEREPRYISIRSKLENRADKAGLLTPKAAALLTATATGSSARSGRAPVTPSKRQGQVLRPGGARSGRPVPKPRPAPVVDDEALDDDADFDLDVDEGGSGASAPATRPGPARSTGAAKRPAASANGRPAPRPRKKKGGRRR